MIKVGEAFEKVAARERWLWRWVPHQFLDEVDARGGGFDVMIKVGEAFEKLLRGKGSFGAGCHTNFSMMSMREKGGFDVTTRLAGSDVFSE